MTSTEEKELIAACLEGDTTAWDNLFDEHYTPTARFVFQLGADLNPSDVEEICQETFITIVKKLKDFRFKSSLRTWILRVSANKAHDYRNKQLAAKRGGGTYSVPLEQDNAPFNSPIDTLRNPGLQPDEELINSEQMTLLQQCIDQLKQPCKELIELRYFADMPYDEIAREFNLNPKTISSRLSRCLDKLERIAVKVFKPEKSRDNYV
ncbi:MAG: RNA polymerase sigma factor [Verrucomicrobia bacterium]|nr:RNA polymerase sigma factor [Verrucomicrobiota bacterium]MCF7707301.1 RNA polymerase sigma factor [Verrucomicrobiota bacterium]